MLLTMGEAADEVAAETESASESADQATGPASVPSPLVVIGVAFVAGAAVARWLDWRERARAAA